MKDWMLKRNKPFLSFSQMFTNFENYFITMAWFEIIVINIIFNQSSTYSPNMKPSLVTNSQ